MSSNGCIWCPNGPSNSTSSSVGVILAVASITLALCFVSLSCCCMIFSIRRITNSRNTTVVAEPATTPTAADTAATVDGTGTAGSPAHRTGLDGVLTSNLTFPYASSGDQGKLDCAICLSDMKDGEKARRLSGCRHCFHAECVDEWLRSRSTCPICRSSAKADCSELHV